MKRVSNLLLALLLVVGLAASAHATLILRGQGTSVHGTYNLIYDDDLDITWYDYRHVGPYGWGYTWDEQVDWADALSVNFGGNIYTDWRLPKTVDGHPTVRHPNPSWYDGTGPNGFNITTSEMGHLFYTELGNLGRADTSGNLIGCGDLGLPSCLSNTGPFQNLFATVYWSGTEYSAFATSSAWTFDFFDGGQEVLAKTNFYYYAMAVRDGDVAAPVPEPGTLLLLGSGLAGLAGLRRRLKNRAS